MSGPEAIRGFNFQTAVAVRVALEALSTTDVAALRVEGAQDIVDLETLDSNGARTRLVQVKARAIDSPLGPAEIGDILEQFAALEDADRAVFTLMTDGRLGRTAHERFIPALTAVARGAIDKKARKTLEDAGLKSATPSFAKRVEIKELQPGVDVQLSLAEAETRALIELHEPCDAAQARAAVDALFRKLGLTSGIKDADRRVVARVNLAEALGVPLTSIDSAAGWDAGVRARYIEAVVADPFKSPMIIVTDVAVSEPVGLAVRTLTHSTWTPHDHDTTDGPAAPARVDDLLLFNAAALAGPAGGGKSTSVGLLARAAADQNLLPIVLAAVDVAGSSIEREVTRAAQVRLERTFAPGVGAAMLRDDRAVLIIDGAGDVPSVERASLAHALRRLRGDLPHLRVIATGRDGGALADMQLPVVELLAPTVDDRLDIATQVLGNAQKARRELQAIMRTSTTIGTTPLLLVLALQDSVAGESATSRAELLDRFVERLWTRAGADHTDAITAAAAAACATLLGEDQRRPSRYRWLRALGEALSQLRDDSIIVRATYTPNTRPRRSNRPASSPEQGAPVVSPLLTTWFSTSWPPERSCTGRSPIQSS